LFKPVSSEKKSDRYPWYLLTVTELGALSIGLNISVLNVALPTISKYFQASSIETTWILLSYMLFNSVLILVFGRLADILGRRNLYLIGVLEYTIASLLCGFAPNALALILLRILQAFGAALLITNTTPLITDVFPSNRLGQALGIHALVLSISQMLGPALGGYLTANFGWQWIFWFHVPIGLLCFFWGLKNIRKTEVVDKHKQFDILGNLTVFLGLGGLVIALSVGGEIGFISLPVLPGIVIFVACFVFFLRHERKIEHPMIDLKLFKNHRYAMSNLAALISACMQAAILLLIPLHLQYVSHFDAQAAGYTVLPLAIGVALASPTAGTLARRFQAKYLSTLGLCMATVGVAMMVIYALYPVPLAWLIAAEILFGVGKGFFAVPNTTTIMLSVPPERRGVANGIRSTSQNVGKLISTALSMTLITVFLPTDLKNAVYRGQGKDFSGAEQTMLANGFVVAFAIMLLFGIAAMIVSWSRGEEKPEK